MKQRDRLIFHIDVNSAFLSWEAAKRVAQGEPDLRDIPAAIGGDKDKRTGIILAKSIPAKKYGVTTGEPVSMALRKCPVLVLVRPDFRLYERNSRKFMDICREYAPVVEKYSIDECFCDMTGTGMIYPDPLAIAYEMKDRIRDMLGFTVNVGIGRTKLAAKMASDFEKPDKVHTLFPEEIPVKMWPLPVGELFTVGKHSAERLEKNQIRTIGDLAQMSLPALQQIAGVKNGIQYHEFANGIDASEVLAEREDAKGYSISTTLEEDVTTLEEASKILLRLADSVSSRMRADGVRALGIGVTIRSSDFTNRSHQKKLENSTDVTDEIVSVCSELFGELWDGKTPLRLIGVSLTNVTKEAFEQLSFFEDKEKKEKSKKLDQVMDQIRNRYGMDAVVRGSLTDGKEVGKKYRAQMENRRAEENFPLAGKEESRYNKKT